MRKKLIEVALPLEAINVASAREKSIRHGHPSTLHLWWARRPLAACRAVLFGQLVDDPSSWPDLFPTDEDQERERKRLFAIIEQLVLWENSNNETVVNAARLEIARSLARGRQADGLADPRDAAILKPSPPAATVNAYLAEVAPPVHDPFAGGGSIPLEAQRLGLRAIASDLNPVAVLINKALIEIPPKFAGRPPVNPDSRRKEGLRTWKGAEGLAEDVRYYGQRMRDEAKKRIGHLYPDVALPQDRGGGRAEVIAWIWARTVASPNPACHNAQVPLVSSYWLSRRVGQEAWLEPIIDRKNHSWRFDVRAGRPNDATAVAAGTKTGRGDYRCIFSGDPIPADFLRSEGQAGRIGTRLIAIVAGGGRGRIFLPAQEQHERAARVPPPDDAPDTDLPKQALGFRVQSYGILKHRDLFTPRQLTALVTFSNLITSMREHVLENAGSLGTDYADAVAVYCAMAISKSADLASSLCRWQPNPEHLKLANVFGRSAVSMCFDFGEGNPFGDSTGNFRRQFDLIAEVLNELRLPVHSGEVVAESAIDGRISVPRVISTDPPYFDNVPYADLSDYFYIWLRKSLVSVVPSLFQTMLVPKGPELIAEPFRHGSKGAAELFFMEGMSTAVRRMASSLPSEFPATIYYAFKQAETNGDIASSTGWETFLEAVVEAGFAIVGTWPVRTERSGRMRDIGSNALATSILLVCRRRSVDARAITRADFRRSLRQELPAALKALQHGNIAPVDVAQASIGPGIAIFSRHSKVLEADGSTMSVRTALQLINQALDEYLAEQEGEFDADTRFAVTWFETRGFEAGPYGEAETLATARNVSVSGVAEAGVLASAAGKVRLLKREELPDDWDPTTDKRLPIWEATQHLIKRLDQKGEQGAAELLANLGPRGAAARDLAYRLYTTCERKGWADEARAYNGLVVAWPELEKLAAERGRPAPVQGNLL